MQWISQNKTGPLSLTRTWGIPQQLKRVLDTWMVLLAVVLSMTCTSGHLECASTTTRYTCSSNGPAKSTCILYQGLEGHIQGCKGAKCGSFAPVDSSDLIVDVGTPHITELFILTTPGCAVWISFKTRSCHFGGTTTRHASAAGKCQFPCIFYRR